MTPKAFLARALPVGLAAGMAIVLLSLEADLIDDSIARFAATLAFGSAAVMMFGNGRAAALWYCFALIIAWPSIAAHVFDAVNRPTGSCNGCYEIGTFFKGVLVVAAFVGFGATLLPVVAMFWYHSRAKSMMQRSSTDA